MLVRVYTCQNAILLEITCSGSNCVIISCPICVFRNFWAGRLFQHKMPYIMVSKKKNQSCEDGIEKSIPRNHCHNSARILMPKSDLLEGYFCPTLTLMIDMIDSYIHGQSVRETEILVWVRKICPQDHHSSSVSLAT